MVGTSQTQEQAQPLETPEASPQDDDYDDEAPPSMEHLLALAKEDPKDKLKELRRQQKRGRVPSTAPDGCVPSQMEVPEDDDQEDEALWAGPAL